MKALRDHLLGVTEKFDEARLPPRFSDAREILRRAIRRAEAAGIRDDTLTAVFMSEALPRLLCAYGPEGGGAILRRLADTLDPGRPHSTEPH